MFGAEQMSQNASLLYSRLDEYQQARDAESELILNARIESLERTRIDKDQELAEQEHQLKVRAMELETTRTSLEEEYESRVIRILPLKKFESFLTP